MFTSFTVKNFRCFSELTVEPLARVNLITGANNVGKTALLEAIFVHIAPTNPRMTIQLLGARGVQCRNKDDISEMWAWYFNEKQTGRPAQLISVDSEGARRELRFEVQPEAVEEVGTEEGSAERSMSNRTRGPLHTGPPVHGRLIYHYEDSHGAKCEAEATALSDGVAVQHEERDLFPLSCFLAAHLRSAQDDAARFSELVRKKRKEVLVEPLRILEPRLQDIAVLATGAGPLLSGDVGLNEMIPLPLVGGGMVRLASIVLAIGSAPGGIVLVDEIENGLHYSVMEKVWRAIGTAARNQDVQIFATTHSFECIGAACDAFAEMPEDFRLFRLEREENRIRAVNLDTEMATTALRHGMEVR